MSVDLQPEREESILASVATPGLGRSAGLLSMGNAVSRVLGLVREMVIAYFFGATGQVSAFRVAALVPTMLYDFLVGGMLSAALVPILSSYARVRTRSEFLHLVGVLAALFTTILALMVLLLQIFAPQVAWLLAGGLDQFDPELMPLTVRLIRLTAPAVWLFSMAGLLTGILYALQRFTFPAIASAVYNLGIVVSAPLLVDRIGVASLAVGIVAGSGAQFLLMGWDIRRAGVPLRLHWQWRHPALRRILILYAPIAAGLVVSLFQISLDRRLASSTGPQSIAWMANATTLQQMPLGLISVAIALASLPKLSSFAAEGNLHDYRQTLGRGLRMVMMLIAPAAVGLWFLGEPVTQLLFQRGDFLPADTVQVVRALDIYLLGMLFAAIDFPLNYAFYARNNTLLPALVGVLSVGVYVVVAFALLEPLGFLGLVWADTAKQGAHAGIMIFFLWRTVGRLGAQVSRGFVSIALAAGLMALWLWWVQGLALWAGAAGGISALVQVALAGGSALLLYGSVLGLLGLPELEIVTRRLRRRMSQ